jgi:hypothetical protein
MKTDKGCACYGSNSLHKCFCKYSQPKKKETMITNIALKNKEKHELNNAIDKFQNQLTRNL